MLSVLTRKSWVSAGLERVDGEFKERKEEKAVIRRPKAVESLNKRKLWVRRAEARLCMSSVGSRRESGRSQVTRILEEHTTPLTVVPWDLFNSSAVVNCGRLLVFCLISLCFHVINSKSLGIELNQLFLVTWKTLIHNLAFTLFLDLDFPESAMTTSNYICFEFMIVELSEMLTNSLKCKDNNHLFLSIPMLLPEMRSFHFNLNYQTFISSGICPV